MEVLNVKLSQIKNVSENYRCGDSESEVSGLMNSIKQVGLVNPVTVKKIKGGFELIAGFRRYNAMKKLKSETIDVNVISNGVNSKIVNLVENLQREETSSYEVGRGISNAMKEGGLSVAEVAVILGKNKNTVEEYLALFNATPAKFRNKVRSLKGKSNTNAGKGLVCNSAALAIISLAKSGKITAKKKVELFEMVSKDNSITTKDIKAVGTSANSEKELAALKKKSVSLNFSILLSKAHASKIGARPRHEIMKLIEKHYKVKLL